MKYITELSQQMDKDGNWIYPEDVDPRPWREKIADILRQIKAGKKRGAPTLPDHDAPLFGEPFEAWWLRTTPEGRRLLAGEARRRGLIQDPQEQRALAVFVKGVALRHKEKK